MSDDAQKRAMLLASVGMAELGYVNDLNMRRALDNVVVTLNMLVDKLRANFDE